jgi:alanine-glyoxylate transaminase/serine-glyoxylate transaminase/serine-pyruvate transaminase
MSFSFQKRTLLGPGPSDVPPRILEALGKPTLGHLDPQFITLMDEIKTLLKDAFLTQNEMTYTVSAPGSAGMETCFVNLVSPGDKVLVCINGVFGKRMLENVKRIGGEPVVLEFDWGKSVDPQKVEEAFKKNSAIKIMAFVHAETSTGVLSDAKTLSGLAKKYNCLTIVDAVTSFAGTPLKVDEWELDAVYTGSQKCLSCVPGLSPVTLGAKALQKIEERSTPVQSWFLDVSLIKGYWGEGSQRTYHHTAPVNSLYALHEALTLLKEEGLEQSWERHIKHHQLLKEGLLDLGLSFFVDEKERAPQINAVTIPKGVDERQVRQRLLQEFNLEIGAGLGPLAGKIWRIGLMGYSSREENVNFLLDSLKKVLA